MSSPEDAWSFTRRLARRRYVNRMIAEADGSIRSNSYPLKYPVIGYQPPATPWTIDLTDDVDHLFWYAVFDLDAKRTDDFDRATDDAGVLVRVLRSAEIPHVVCRSSPTGGYHVWIALTGVAKPVMEQLANAAKAVLPTLDHGLLHNAATGAVRPPGAPHARGGSSIVMEGADPVETLLSPTVGASDLLRAIAAFRELRPEMDPADTVPNGPVVPGHRTHRRLPAWGAAHMATAAGGRDPSRTGYLCLLAAAASGWTLRDVEHAARTAPGMEHYRTQNKPTGGRAPRKRDEAASRIARQWAKAQERAVYYRNAPTERAERDVSELRAILHSTEAMLEAFRVSPGRWGRSEADFHDSSVLVALAWLSIRSGQRNVAAALRSVADLTGIPSSTVDRSLRRLRAGGWVARHRQADGPHAAVWRLTEQFSTPHKHDGPLQDVTARPPDELFDIRARLLNELEDRIEAGRHDVFDRGALGPTARRAYEALTGSEDETERVADRAGLTNGRTGAALARLKRWALAVRTPHGWRRRRHDHRSRVAKLLGVSGRLEHRQERYTQEREIWAWWNADLTFRAGRTARQRRRPGPGQKVMFRTEDDRGDEYSFPAYPRDAAGRGVHSEAWRYVTRGLLQQLRDVELAA